MTPPALHRVADRVRLLVPIAVCALLCAWTPGALASARRSVSPPAHPGGSHADRAGVSQYPAGANRPAIPARPSELAHRAGVTGGTGSARRHGKKAKPRLRGNPARALLAYKTMQQYFYIPGTGLYKGEPYSFLWPFSQALAATVSLSRVPGQATKLARDLHARMYGLRRYFEPPAQPSSPEVSSAASAPALPSYAGSVVPPLGPGGTSYYDDNEWVGIELARVYQLNRDPTALQQAKQIMAFVMAGWKTVGPNGKPLPCPGGVPFSNSPTNNSRNTVTDGPAAELGVQLYRITGEAQYLRFAQMAYAWVRQCLLTPANLYADHIQNGGEVEPMVWSYNQGSMMGAGALLYQATGDGAYLYQARQTAKAALALFTLEKLELENPFFVSVYFRNLLYLDSVTHDPPGPKLVQTYLDYAWQNLRLSNNLFVSGSPSTSTLLGQAAIVQLYSLLCTPPGSYF